MFLFGELLYVSSGGAFIIIGSLIPLDLYFSKTLLGPCWVTIKYTCFSIPLSLFLYTICSIIWSFSVPNFISNLLYCSDLTWFKSFVNYYWFIMNKVSSPSPLQFLLTKSFLHCQACLIYLLLCHPKPHIILVSLLHWNIQCSPPNLLPNFPQSFLGLFCCNFLAKDFGNNGVWILCTLKLFVIFRFGAWLGCL